MFIFPNLELEKEQMLPNWWIFGKETLIHTLGIKARYTLYVKDDERKTIVAIYSIVAPQLWSYIVLWKWFKDGRANDLATKDDLRKCIPFFFSSMSHSVICLIFLIR